MFQSAYFILRLWVKLRIEEQITIQNNRLDEFGRKWDVLPSFALSNN